MNFGDFVEKMEETPLCCELKQLLDKWYEWYVKDPDERRVKELFVYAFHVISKTI